MLKRMWSHILAFISHPVFGIVLAILVLVAGWKMTANGANALLFTAWAIVVAYAFLTGPLPQLEVIPRIAGTLVIAGAFGLAIYYTLWTIKNPAPAPTEVETPSTVRPSSPSPAPSPTVVPESDLVPDLHKQYLTDYKGMKFGFDKVLQSPDGTVKSTINVQINLDHQAKSKFLSVYIPHVPSTYDVCKSLPELHKTFLADGDTVRSDMQMPGDATVSSSRDMIFTGVIYIYHEDRLTLEELGSLENLFKAQKLFVHFRDTNYATTMWLSRKAAASGHPSSTSTETTAKNLDLRVSALGIEYDQEKKELVAHFMFRNNGSMQRTVLNLTFIYWDPNRESKNSYQILSTRESESPYPGDVKPTTMNAQTEQMLTCRRIIGLPAYAKVGGMIGIRINTTDPNGVVKTKELELMEIQKMALVGDGISYTGKRVENVSLDD